ncbi:DNA gyrase subunit A (plasmid) [Halorhabdus tiamatea SARL4B]|uniref:DNA gyrase subunit A n=2 Tax=Halorhabdus TaxID=146825 RepID=S6D9D6_9EURY|nr:DNA gyrase subunit A [Halorhabdus tiamatea SARL4B]
MVNQENDIDDVLNELIPETEPGSDSSTETTAFTGTDLETAKQSDAAPEPADNTEGFTIEYMRFEAPTYHLTYEGVEKTFCGRDLSDIEYKSTTNEPELLDPCDLCLQIKNQLSEEEQIEKIREELSAQIPAVSEPTEHPLQFERDEVAGLMKAIPTTLETETGDLADLRAQLKLAIEGVGEAEGDPGQFTNAEMRAFEAALDGDGLISSQNNVYIYTRSGLCKRTELSEFSRQRRGGKGVICCEVDAEDAVEKVQLTDPRKQLLVLTNHGLIHQVKANQIAPKERTEPGEQIHEFLDFDPDERIQAILPIETISEGLFLTLATSDGHVKRTATTEFSNIHRGGIQAVELEGDDRICDVTLTNGSMDILLGTNQGRVIRFDETEAREMGRPARGVHGIELAADDHVVGLTTVEPGHDEEILTVTANGYGKRTAVDEYRTQSRYGSGLLDIVTDDRNGPVVDITRVQPTHDIVLASGDGQLIRIGADDISRLGRNTQGVQVMDLDDGDRVSGVATCGGTE